MAVKMEGFSRNLKRHVLRSDLGETAGVEGPLVRKTFKSAQ